VDLPTLVQGESYKINLLLFDENKRIVGEYLSEPFTYKVEVWQGNKLGLDDVVWEPFTPMVVKTDGFETLKHQFTISPLGLPAQISIKADPRELPLEWRGQATVPPEGAARSCARRCASKPWWMASAKSPRS
jgi:hypothetical protein